MEKSLQRTSFLQAFSCLGDKCEDTCCKGWGMQVDAATVTRYCQGAPELVADISTGEAEHIMRRDPETDYCVKFDNGWCGIHKKYGSDFLGDACHFFPRITRQLGDTILQTASLSCPEIVRLVLHTDHAFDYETSTTDRLPTTLKNYAPEPLTSEEAIATHHAFVAAADDTTATAEHIICRMHSVTESMKFFEVNTWPSAIHFYLRNAESRLPKTQVNTTDPFNILYALDGLMHAATKSKRPRLEQIVTDMEQALAITLPTEQGQPFNISPESLDRAAKMHELWQQHSSALQPSLRRWLQAQLSVAFFPYAGFGDTLSNRMAIIGVRLATLKLALMAELQLRNTISEDAFTRIVQSLARFMDHLADPTFSLKIYRETEWLQPARLRGLLGDH
jgi:lysine-N-methylase